MSWPVRSRRLHISRQVRAAVQVSLGTVPAGKTWLVKEIDLMNLTGSTASFLVYHQSGAVQAPIYFPQAITTSGLVRAGPFNVVLEAGDQIIALPTVAGEWSIVVYGAQLG